MEQITVNKKTGLFGGGAEDHIMSFDIDETLETLQVQ